MSDIPRRNYVKTILTGAPAGVNTPRASDAIVSGEVDATRYFRPYTSGIRDRFGNNAVVWPGQCNPSLSVAMNDGDRWMVINNLTAEKTLPDFRRFIATTAPGNNTTAFSEYQVSSR